MSNLLSTYVVVSINSHDIDSYELDRSCYTNLMALFLSMKINHHPVL